MVPRPGPSTTTKPDRGRKGLGERKNLKKRLHRAVAQEVSGFTVGKAAVSAGDERRANDEQAGLGELGEGLLGEVGGGDGVVLHVGVVVVVG